MTRAEWLWACGAAASVWLLTVVHGARSQHRLRRWYESKLKEFQEQAPWLADELGRFWPYGSFGFPTQRDYAERERIWAKRKALLGTGPKTFYYIDAAQVKDMYMQTPAALEPAETETEEVKTGGAEVRGGVKAIESGLHAGLHRGTSALTRRRFALDLSPATMYARVEQVLFEEADVTLGIEDFPLDESALKVIEAMCDALEKRLGHELQAGMRDGLLQEKLRQEAKEHIGKLATVAGYVAMQAEFSVKELRLERFTLALRHPASEHIAESDTPAQILVSGLTSQLTGAGQSTFSAGAAVKVSMLGKVVRWDAQRGVLSVSPIVIY